MMNTLKPALIIVLALLLLAGWYFVPRTSYENSSKDVSATNAEPSFAWKFVFASSTDDAAPRSSVELISDGDVYDVGSYAGSCARIAPENLLPDEVSGVLCWWAGAGDELGVFKEEQKYVVKLGSQDEGTAEEGGFRGDFKELFTVER